METETKRPPFYRRQFPMKSLLWNELDSAWNFTKYLIDHYRCNLQYASIGSDNGLVSNRHQAIAWISFVLVILDNGSVQNHDVALGDCRKNIQISTILLVESISNFASYMSGIFPRTWWVDAFQYLVHLRTTEAEFQGVMKGPTY